MGERQEWGNSGVVAGLAPELHIERDLAQGLNRMEHFGFNNAWRGVRRLTMLFIGGGYAVDKRARRHMNQAPGPSFRGMLAEEASGHSLRRKYGRFAVGREIGRKVGHLVKASFGVP
jgi:hypothetical protein